MVTQQIFLSPFSIYSRRNEKYFQKSSWCTRRIYDSHCLIASKTSSFVCHVTRRHPLQKPPTERACPLPTVYLNFTFSILNFSNFFWNATINLQSYWPNFPFFRVQVNLQYYKLHEYNYYFNTTQYSTNVREGVNISFKIKLDNNNSNNNYSPHQKKKILRFW